VAHESPGLVAGTVVVAEAEEQVEEEEHEEDDEEAEHESLDAGASDLVGWSNSAK
jgi:hypothetical protein